MTVRTIVLPRSVPIEFNRYRKSDFGALKRTSVSRPKKKKQEERRKNEFNIVPVQLLSFVLVISRK